ncbi:septal ring lytic transglycosylase RlpA family protein [Alphaproteobacteria bacterium]|nr:septal ring lytic transglycosylase RlpA family protein [Alphaproteobacteria bacterium]
MILIFSKHKKQGAEVGRAIKKTLLMGTAAYPTNKKNKVLTAAINDPYVKGFVIYLSAMSIDMVFKGAFWKKKKRIEFLVECWQELGIPMNNVHEFLRVIGDPIKEGVWDKSGQYSEGKNAAALVLTAAYGILNREALQTEIIVKAQKRANDIMGNNSKVYSDSSKAAMLSAAVCEVTIEKHMKSYYIDP